MSAAKYETVRSSNRPNIDWGVGSTTLKHSRLIPGIQVGATDWTEVVTNDGSTYYYNSKTSESSWAIPDEVCPVPCLLCCAMADEILCPDKNIATVLSMALAGHHWPPPTCEWCAGQVAAARVDKAESHKPAEVRRTLCLFELCLFSDTTLRRPCRIRKRGFGGLTQACPGRVCGGGCHWPLAVLF